MTRRGFVAYTDEMRLRDQLIVADYNAGANYRQLALIYGLHPSRIAQIVERAENVKRRCPACGAQKS